MRKSNKVNIVEAKGQEVMERKREAPGHRE